MDPRLYDASAIASGFVPGSGLMDFIGQAPAIGGGMGPSFMENMKKKQYVDAMLQMAGAAGDAMMVVPPVGMTVKAATTAGKTARAGSKTADALNAAKKTAKKAAAPQEEALRLAQQRAALPVEEGGLGLPKDNTPMDRAKAMGFNMPAYHTSRTGVDTDVLDSGKYAIAPFDSIGTHFGTKEAALDRFNRTTGTTEQIKGSSYPVLLKGDKPYLTQQGEIYREDPLAMMLSEKSDYGNLPKSNANLRAEIFENNSIIPYINDVEATGSISYIAPPESIRSRFAAFDPFRRNAAIAAAMGVAAPNLLAAEPEKKKEEQQSNSLLRMLGF